MAFVDTASNDAGFNPEELAAWNGQLADSGAEPEVKPAPAAPAPEPKPAAVTSPVAPVAAPAAPQAAAPDDGDDVEEVPGQDGRKRRVVNYGALHQARLRLKAVELERDAERAGRLKDNEARARIEERLALLSEAMAPAAQPAQPEAPLTRELIEKDPFSAIERVVAMLQQGQQQVNEVAGTIQETQEEQALRQHYEADVIAFARQNQDFGAAYQHLHDARDKMLKGLGYDDPNERMQIRVNEEKGLVKRAKARGVSPAQMVYGLARDLGYAPKQPAQPAAAAAAQPAPAVPAVAQTQPATPAQPSVVDEVKRLQDAQRATRSLSAAGGSPGQTLSLDMLANMSEAQFDKFYRKNKAAVDEIMGA